MKRAAIVALVCINVALLLGLMWGSAVPWAKAQGRYKTDYLMVTGRHPIGETEALYIVDLGKERLVALRWDIDRRRLVVIGDRGRDLKNDFKSARAEP